MNGTRFIFIWVWYLLLKCGFVLLVDVEWFEDKSILLQPMSRTYYQWYFYLLILFTYVPSDKLFSVIDIWKSECLVVIIALLYGDNLLFMLSIRITIMRYVSHNCFRLTFYTKQSFLMGSFLVVIEWFILSIAVRNYFRSHKWNVTPGIV